MPVGRAHIWIVADNRSPVVGKREVAIAKSHTKANPDEGIVSDVRMEADHVQSEARATSESVFLDYFSGFRKQDRDLNNQRAPHTPNYKQKVTRTEQLDLCTIKNLRPSRSKSKVFKVKRNHSIMKFYRDSNGSE